MKVLLETCMWGLIQQPQIDAGHDVIWAGGWPDDPGDGLVSFAPSSRLIKREILSHGEVIYDAG